MKTHWISELIISYAASNIHGLILRSGGWSTSEEQ